MREATSETRTCASAWPSARGEAAERIRNHDWSSTPLGPLAEWPQSLRTSVDLVLASPLAMAVLWGPELVQIYNDTFARLLGDAERATLGRPLGDSSPGTWADAALIRDRVLAGEALTLDHAVPPDSDNRRARAWFALWCSPLRSEAGLFAGALITAVETTRRHLAEQELDRSTERLRLALDASSAGAWSWDARTNESTWDDRYHEMYRLPPDAPRAFATWLERIHPNDRPRVVARIDEVVRTPGDDEWNMEFRAVDSEGRVAWMHGLGRAKRDAAGTLLSMTGINLDVSERKRAEERLRLSEAQLQLFVEYAPAALAMFDRDMRYLAVSRRWMQSYLPGVGDIIGYSHYDVFPDCPEHWKEAHRRGLSGEIVSAEGDRWERADGSIRWIRYEVRPWRATDGSVGGIVIFTEDITAEHQSKENRELLIAELQHRTRNVLTVVEAIAQQTMRSATSIETFLARFGVRLRALSRVQGLLSRSDREPITIGRLVRMELEALGAEANGRVSVEGPEVPLRKRTVQTLALAIHELATNARKHGALRHPQGRLSVSWRAEGPAARSDSLVLDWIESGTEPEPARDATRRDGYGRMLIERALPYSMSAQTTFELCDDGFQCSIRLPLAGADDDKTIA